MFPESHGFVAVPVTRSNNFVSVQLDRDKLEHVSNFDTACNRHSNETVTLGQHVTKSKNMRKWMSNFSENLRIVALIFL